MSTVLIGASEGAMMDDMTTFGATGWLPTGVVMDAETVTHSMCKDYNRRNMTTSHNL